MIDLQTRAALCDPALLATRERHMVQLQALFAGQPPGRALFLKGVRGKGASDPYVEPERWVEEALDDLATRAEALRDADVFRPLALEFGPYGVHFIDKILGAEVLNLGDGDEPNWQVHTLDAPVGSLRPPDLDRDPTWALCKRVMAAFLAADVTLPFFGLPTIASALNVAVNLYGEGILVAMLADADAARHDLGVINGLLCALHRWYRAHVPPAQLQPVVADQRTQPPGFGQLCGCTTQLISARTYREYVAPLDDALLAVYAHGGMIHLCGRHTQHIAAWNDMRSLRAVQLNDRAAQDLAIYARDLRPDVVLYVNPCAEMPVERILEVTAGRRMVVVDDAVPSQP
jgi:hypothetical protein